MRKITALLLMMNATLVHAELQTLDNQALRTVEGQAGADLSLKLSLNHDIMSDPDLQDATKKPTFNCTELPYCRLAMSFNKRFVQKYTNTGVGDTRPTDSDDLWTVPASDPTEGVGTEGRKLWLVMKGIQGTVNIQKLGLESIDLTYNRKSDNKLMIKPAIKLSFSADKPIQIRDFGFDALSIEQDKFTSYYETIGGKTVLTERGSTNPDDYGYLKLSKYTAVGETTDATAPTTGPKGTTANNYDTGKEMGFMGLRMNGNLALQGNIMMFGCDASHPRC